MKTITNTNAKEGLMTWGQQGPSAEFNHHSDAGQTFTVR